MIRSKQLSKSGEIYFENYCKESNILFSKSTYTEDVYSGFDYIVNLDGCFKNVDVKYTPDIYFLNYSIKDKKYKVRHPFRQNTKMDYYFFRDRKFVEKDIFFKEYIKDLDGFKNYLLTLDFKPGCLVQYNNFRKVKSLKESLFTVKRDLKRFLKDKSIIEYNISEEGYFFKIKKYV